MASGKESQYRAKLDISASGMENIRNAVSELGKLQSNLRNVSQSPSGVIGGLGRQLNRVSAGNASSGAAAAAAMTQEVNKAKEAVTTLGSRTRGAVASISSVSRTGASAMRNISRETNRTSAGIEGLAQKALGAVAAFISLRNITSQLGKSLEIAGNFRSYEVSFQTLLGSKEAADARLKELTNFAISTPFKLDDLAKANRTLETMTRGALSGEEGMRLLGDAASVSQARVSNLAMWLGRMYEGLSTGFPVGEAMMRFQELGLISGQARQKITELQEAGQGMDAWKVVLGELSRFTGQTERLSESWNGVIVRIQDGMDLLRREIGLPITDALTPSLDAVADGLRDARGRASNTGEVIGGSIDIFSKIIEDPERLNYVIAESMHVGGLRFVNTIANGIQAAVRAFIAAISGFFQTLFSLEFWGGLKDTLASLIGIITPLVAAGLLMIFKGLVPMLAPVAVFFDDISKRIEIVVLRLMAAGEALLSGISPNRVDRQNAVRREAALNSQIRDIEADLSRPWEEKVADSREGMNSELDDGIKVMGGTIAALSGNAVSGLAQVVDILVTNFGSAFANSFKGFDWNQGPATKGIEAGMGRLKTLITDLMKSAEFNIPEVNNAPPSYDFSQPGRHNVADSLTKIGGGGGIFTVGDIQKAQLNAANRSANLLQVISRDIRELADSQAAAAKSPTLSVTTTL